MRLEMVRRVEEAGLGSDVIVGRQGKRHWWPERWARHGLLARVRGFFLLNALLALVAVVMQLGSARDQAAGLRLAAGAAVGWLGWWWVRGWRRHRFPALVEPVEWLVPVLVALAFNQATMALGVLYGALAFRALYGDRRTAVARGVLAVGVLVATPLLVIARGGPNELNVQLFQIPTVLVLSGITYLLGATLARQERAVAREQVLTQTGTVLTTTTDRQAIYQAAVDTALTLLGHPAGTHAALAVLSGAEHRIVAAAGDDSAGLIGTTPRPAALPVAFRAALDQGRPVYAEHVAANDLAAAVDFTPKTGGLLLLPLRSKDGPLGLLAVASDQPLPAEVRGSLETLANQVALGLESATLTEELTTRAFYDSLTGLANRFLLHDRLDHAVAHTRRSGTPTALLLLDMDGFKQINDSLGHEIGDDVLVGVAERMRGCVREVDTIGRLGGDEFAIVLQDVTGSGDAVAVAERVTDALKQPIDVDGHQITARVSIGIATTGHPEDRQQDLDSASLLRNADVAMYQAKSRHTGSWELYQPIMHADAADRRLLEADLHHALDRGELLVHYQPIVALDSSAITGVEALLRWQHPTRGLIPPAEFIPLAEETGLIGRIGRWVLDQACRQVAAWQATLSDDHPLELSVNLSPAELDAPDLVERVAGTLDATGLAPHLLVLELTEGVLARNTAATAVTLTRLKELGVRLAIDDFGTGFSSLGYLERFPIDILKIDRSFIAKLAHGPEATPLADAVIRLGQALHLETIAEGIETDHQLAALRDLGCRLGQGYLFARPSEPDRVRALLDQAPATATPGPPPASPRPSRKEPAFTRISRP
jgi:diguanylate cyclase (GGDEF)-like protein